MKRYILYILLIHLIYLTTDLHSGSYYYYEDFSTNFGTSQMEWSTNMHYGRDGIVFGLPRADNNSVNAIVSNQLRMWGSLYDNFDWGTGTNSYAYEGYWVNRVVHNTNKFGSSISMPFGVEAIRAYCNLDVSTNVGDIDYLTRHGVVGFWLYIDDIPDKSVEWQSFENFIQFGDHVGDYEIGPGDEGMRQRLSYYNGSEYDFDLTQAVRPDGRIIDLTAIGNWDYALYSIKSIPNTNQITFRMTHDGSYIKFYMNPNPRNTNSIPYPNEFCYLDKRQVVWNQDIQFMFTHEQQCESFYPSIPNTKAHIQDAYWDDVRVRSAANRVIAGFNPPDVRKTTNYQWVTLILTNEILQNNAGINYIKVIKPAYFEWYTNITAGFVVRTHYDNNITERTLTTQIFVYDTFPASGEVYIMTNFGATENSGQDEVRLILGNQITNMTQSENIEIDMLVLVTNEFLSTEFDIYVMAEMFDDMTFGKERYSTCGWQKTSNSAILYKSPAPAYGYASIKPNQIIQGADEYYFTYYVKSGSIYSEDINQVAISIPHLFQVDIGSVDSFLLIDDSVISITTNNELVGTNEIILIDYNAAGSKIPAGGEMDIVSFRVTGNIEKDIYEWKSWVDNNTLDGNSIQTFTNSIFPSQFVEMLAAHPNTAAGVTFPVQESNRIPLFNTISTYTLEYTIENRADISEIDNEIQIAIITNPGVFTNIEIISDQRIDVTNIGIGYYLPNYSVITLHYYKELNGPIPPQNNDIIKFRVQHSITNPGSTNARFSCIVNNSNSMGFYPVNVNMVQDVSITDPYPVGKVDCQPQNGILYTSDTTNRIEYKIFNNAVSGLINFADIIIPTNYFTLITGITSSRISSGISVTNMTIHLDYNAGGNPIDVNQFDTITFDLVNKYTNYSVPVPVLVDSIVFNTSKTQVTGDKDLLLGLDKYLYFVPQESRVESYVSNNMLKTEVSTSTLYYIFDNKGDPGNRVNFASVQFTGSGGGGDIISPITKVTGFSSGLWDISGLSFSNASFGLDGGEREILKIIIDDTIISKTFRDLLPVVTVNTSIRVPTSKPDGKTNRIVFRIPPPAAMGSISPSVMFAFTNKVTNSFIYSIYNDGEINNLIEKVIIHIPPQLYGRAVAVSSTWLGGSGNITNTFTNIIIDYSSANSNLEPKSFDNITIVITNNISTNTVLYWPFSAANNDGNSPTTNNIGTLPGRSKFLHILERPFASIQSETNILDSSQSNYFVYKINNPLEGEEILNIKLIIPSIYSVRTNTLSSSGKEGATVFSISNNYIIADYSANTIKPGEVDQISFTILDSVNKNTNRTKWTSSVNYYSNDIFYFTDGDSSQYLNMILDPASADFSLNPDILYTTGITNTISVIISNTGSGDNYITRLRIDYPESDFTMLMVDSSMITNPINEYWAGGYLYLKYDLENTNLSVGQKDTIQLRFTDNITLMCTKTLYCSPNNFDPGIDIYSSLPESAIIPFVFPADAYIIPNNYSGSSNIKSTTATNILTYKILNQGESSPIRQAVITIPSIISNIIDISSSYMFTNTNIVWSSDVSSVTLNYFQDINGELPVTENDTITMKLVDNFIFGETNVIFECFLNDGYNIIKSLTASDQSKAVSFYMPPASANFHISPGQIYTTSFSNTFICTISNLGSGSDNIRKARISMPTGFTLVNNIQSLIINNDSLNAYQSSNHVILDYENDGNFLLAGQSDTIIFKAHDNIISEDVYTFSVSVCNYASNWQTASVTPGMNQFILTRLPDFDAEAHVESDLLYATDITNHHLIIKVENTGQISNDIYRVRITVPDPVFVTNNINVSSISIDSNYISVISNYIILDYETAGDVITEGEIDTINLKVFDGLLTGWTNVTWKIDCEFITSFGVFYETGTHFGESKDVTIIMPDASASAYIEPDSISFDSISNFFTYYITNTGQGTDRIIKARISIPSAFTLVKNIQSTVIADDSSYAYISNNYILLDYQNDGSFISRQIPDIITFTAFDNATNEEFLQWPSYVYNWPVNWQTSDVYNSRTQTVWAKLPDYGAETCIEPNMINTTDTTNHVLNIKLTNSNLTNDIFRTEIYIPLPYFTTNQMQVSSGRVSNSYITISSNSILIDYQNASKVMTYGESDEINLRIYDTINSGSVLVTWNVKCEYNTSGGKYISVGTVPGRSRNVMLAMPSAMASASIQPGLVYTIETNKTFTYKIVNTGGQYNDITEARIYIPGPFFSFSGPGYVQSSHISNDAAWAQYSGGFITLRYGMDDNGNLVTGQTDTIIIDTSVSGIIEIDGIDWPSWVTNNGCFDYPNTTVTSGLYRDVDIEELTSQSYAYIKTNTAYITTLSNQFVYTISNASSGTNDYVYQAMIFAPPEITNVYNIRSAVLSNTNNIGIKYTNNSIIIDYTLTGTNLKMGDKDTIFFTAQDNTNYGFWELYWNSKVEYSNGFGFTDTKTNNGYSKNVSMIMPNASAKAFIEPNIIYTHVTNTSFTYTVTNTGSINNEITKLRIYVPEEFTNEMTPAKISSSHLSDTSPVYSDGTITIRYHLDSNGNLKPGELDIISIDAKDNIATEINSIQWLSQVDNLRVGDSYLYTSHSSLQDVDIIEQKSGSQFFTNSFSSGLGADWETNWPYGKEGLNTDTGIEQSSSFNIISNTLKMRGIPYQAHSGPQDYIYNGFWTGRAIMLDKSFSATPEKPFGFEIIRTYSRINAYTGNENPAGERCRTELDIWLVEDNGNVTDHKDAYENYILLYELGVLGKNTDPTSTQKSYVGIFDGVEKHIEFYYSTNAIGERINLTNSSIHSINYNYVWQGTGWPGPNVPNTNSYTFKFTHDGSHINIYINPDPDDNDDYPNEYCLVARKHVLWNNNMKIIIGHEVRNRGIYAQEADYDYLKIISAAKESILSVNPAGISVDVSTKKLTLKLQNQIENTNAGINYIQITKPPDFLWASDPTNDIIVRNFYMNNSTEQTLVTRWFDPSYHYPAANEVSIKTNGDKIILILGSMIGNFDHAEYKNIFIDLDVKITNKNFVSGKFDVHIEARQFEGLSGTWNKGSTCGLQKTIGNAIVYHATGPAMGYSSITPNQILKENDTYNFIYVIGGGGTETGNQAIKQVAILLPDSFNIITNTIDSFFLSDDTNYISLRNYPSLEEPASTFIHIDYAAAGISVPAAGGMDILTFTVKGDMQPGDYQLKCWVDGNNIYNGSLQTETNSLFPSQALTVFAEMPDTAGGISFPTNGNPASILNIKNANILEFTIKNLAPVTETENKIRTAVINVPGVFTNISIIGSTNIITNFVKVNQGIGGNISQITLYYENGGNPINPGNDEDRFRFLTRHNRPPNSGITNLTFSAIVDNGNRLGFQPLSIRLITNLIITDPDPAGAMSVSINDGIMYTSDSTNSIVCKLSNTAMEGDIFYSWITVPTNYFYGITNIYSTRASNIWAKKIAPDTIFIDYSINGASNIIATGEIDTISFKITDKYTNIKIPGSVTFDTRVANYTFTNYCTDLNTNFGLTRTVNFVPQEARVISYASNNYIFSTITKSTLYYILHNNGDPGNIIEYAELDFQSPLITITKATSTLTGTWSISGQKIINNSIALDANETDRIKIVITDNIIIETNLELIPKVTVNTSVLASPELPTGKTNILFINGPSPKVEGSVSPRVLFTSTNATVCTLTYTIYNDGDGSNDIEKTIIYIPEILYGKVSAINSTWLGGTSYITNTATNIIIQYSSVSNLKVGSSDNITLLITNRIDSKTNLYWNFTAENNNGDPPSTNNSGIISGGSKYIYVVERPEAYISSTTNIYDHTTTNTFKYKFVNPVDGSEIIRARIFIPGIYSIVPSSLISSNKGAGISVTNNYIEIDYNADTLKPGQDDTISMFIVDAINKVTNRSKWISVIQHFTDEAFNFTSEDNGTQYLNIILSGPAGNISVVPENIYITPITNTLIITVSNSGEGDNYLTRVRLDYPESDWTIISVDSSIIINSLNEYAASGYLYFKYDNDGKNIPAGTNDIITLKFTDTISSESSCTLRFGMNNSMPGKDEYLEPGNDVVIDYVNPASAYIIPNSYTNSDNIDSTTYTNTYIYKIDNIGNIEAIERVLISLPGIISNVIFADSSYMSSNTNIVWDNNVTGITLNYNNDSNGPLFLTNDTITLQMIDSMNFGYTNVMFECFVDYGSGFIKTLTTGNQSKSIGYYMPPANSAAYIEPIQIFSILKSNWFTSIITNRGTGSDRILKARILIPSGFTAISNIQSSILSNDSLYAYRSNNYIVIDYNSDSRYIAPKSIDMITFLAYDNITLEGSYVWSSEVYNYPGNWQTTSVYTMRSQTVQSVTPVLEAYGGIMPRNIYTPSFTNTFFYTISNSSQLLLNSEIDLVKIYIPVVFTNIYNLQSSILTNSNSMTINWGVSNYILIDYSNEGTNIVKDQKDIITFTARDNIETGDTNVSCNSKVFFTVMNEYIDTLSSSGYVKTISFIMGDSSAQAHITPNRVAYTVTTNHKFNYFIENVSSKNDIITKSYIYIPVPFFTTNNMKVTSSLISTNYIMILTNRIVLDYQTAGIDFVPGTNDVINISIQDTISNGETNVIWNSSCEFNTSFGRITNTGTHFRQSKEVELFNLKIPPGNNLPAQYSVIPTIFNIHKHNTVKIYFGGETPDVRVRIYDMAGNMIKSFGELQGVQYVEWDGRNERGQIANSGNYIVVVRNKEINEKIMMMLIK